MIDKFQITATSARGALRTETAQTYYAAKIAAWQLFEVFGAREAEITDLDNGVCRVVRVCDGFDGRR